MTIFPQRMPGEENQPLPEEEIAREADQLPVVVRRVDRAQLKQFVTTIKSAEQQIGEHIVEALSDDETVAVLTTVVLGDDGMQRIVSAAINPDLMEQVQKLLGEAESQREEEVPCVGFHCFVKPKKKSVRSIGAANTAMKQEPGAS
jgi:hypothetical protein